MVALLRIAILECDKPVDPILQQRGTYGDIFEQLFDRTASGSIKANLPEWKFSKYDVVDRQIYPSLDKIDGLLLTGSKHDSFADLPWISQLVDYVRAAFNARKPIVGICFGHQILARAMGAEVGRDSSGWEVSVDKIHLTDTGISLFGKESLTMHQMHRDVVRTVPDGFQNLGISPCCEIQGLFLPYRALSVQAHPEFDHFITTAILQKRHADGIFSDIMYEDGNTRAILKHDGAVVAKAILQLFVDAQRAQE
ncbi:class I glutamine amidotransferase-like protein [Aaosphaeria arxii CBS 175.79]|uniref:Class I glutamine amidotransferase-like protein n=1 Tax=Aaosphaeria arxii CBS 175.79 TaxID=1450172 RepID=A0A6A5XDB9_9PLEO|nr:class I glutamine amidotransferase-like protein [Aaosphaeria arxii CBS 175.79]KAF2010901.1 class I glutamine amidotransferase-like protein [Aaosphaeria arxii CBS 175.79]